MGGTAGGTANGVLEQAVRTYWPNYSGIPEAGAKGWNNTTRFVKHEGSKYVLRVYETHREPDRILFEHEVLLHLAEAGLTFRTPVPQSGLDGSTLVQLEDGSGRYACLFGYIDGTRPADEDRRPLRAFGQAAGELSAALSRIETRLAPAYRPYYELEQAYPLCTPERVAAFGSGSGLPAGLSGVEPELGYLSAVYRGILQQTDKLRHLPHQLVHGDLNASNMLIRTGEPDTIEALLDFEFCTYDVRAMEAAVLLSGLPRWERGLPDPMALCGDGFRRHAPLEAAEIEAVPLLMRLRKVDVFLHFLTRYWEGTDGIEVLGEQILSLSGDLKRMDDEEAELLRRLTRILSN
ncbi:phosphotransferase [Saccharibacillus deserti]|uniref:phosphotransferase n=1 Tax=Saccharibacillus deserti TaxID=1634444 RepID=UPI001553130D|nr:phosphotransferase [Saccharibacillus deserti]